MLFRSENIDFSRDSVRRILKGMAPADEEESRIEGIKRGLDFISDTSNKITEENFYRLYMTAIGDFLEDENRLKDGELYRHDTVYVVSDRVEHAGIEHGKLGAYMKKLFDFINRKDDINDLVKAAVIHFYIAFLHPYFDGNGRMARLVHLWFLVQNGYRSALFIDFSGKIEKNRKAYYDAFTLIEENKKSSGKIDVTPFVLFFTKYVYNEINKYSADTDVINLYEEAQRDGKITDKESKLWKFVLSFYSNDEFSTKQLEKDFGNAAYATIRGFVLKFEKLGLLTSVKYSSRVKYKINQYSVIYIPRPQSPFCPFSFCLFHPKIRICRILLRKRRRFRKAPLKRKQRISNLQKPSRSQLNSALRSSTA